MTKDNWTEAQRAVWAMEEKYLQALRSGDFDLWITLWHKDFVGWPGESGEPITMDTIRAGEADFRRPRTVSVTEEPVAVQVFGDVAVTYAIGTVQGKDEGHEVAYRGRIAHTWMKQGDRWVIIGGMSAPFPA
jgi:ketosteroid isomerase-like protein